MKSIECKRCKQRFVGEDHRKLCKKCVRYRRGDTITVSEREWVQMISRLASIREWVKKEYENMPYIEIVFGIKKVLDWSLPAQKEDLIVIDEIRKQK